MYNCQPYCFILSFYIMIPLHNKVCRSHYFRLSFISCEFPLCFYRRDLEMEAKLGTSWMRVDGGLDHISVGPLGVYGVNKKGEVYALKPDGSGWVRPLGVYGVNKKGEVYALKPDGSGWVGSLGKYGVNKKWIGVNKRGLGKRLINGISWGVWG